MERQELLRELQGSADYINIYKIESLTEEQAEILALEKTVIKDHTVYFVDFGGYFGYSALVFRRNRHIYYANDYELHHRNLESKDELKAWYIKSLNGKLFTYDEVMGEAKDYDELSRKRYFTHNYFRMVYDTISPFDEKVKTRPDDMPFCWACFCYTYDKELLELSKKMTNHLDEEEKRIDNSPAQFRKKIRYELANHEAGLTGDYEETLFSIGMPYKTLTDVQKKILHEALYDLVYHSDY